MKALKLKATGEWVRFDDDLPEGYGTSLIPQLFPDTATLEDFRNNLQIDEFELVEVDIVTPTISKTETVEAIELFLKAKEYLDQKYGLSRSNTDYAKLMSDFALSMKEGWQREAWEARMEKGKPIKQIHGLGWYDQSEIIETVKYPTFEDFWNRDNSSRDGKEDK